jgi:hypothetical protein
MKINKTMVKAGIVASISMAVIVTACSKSSSSGSSTSAGSNDAATLSTSSETADNAYNDAFSVVMQTGNHSSNGGITVASVNGNISNDGTGSSSILGSCATITVSPADSTTFPKTITVDFGTGCTSLLGFTRKGSITYTLSGHLLYPGTTVSATFNGYSVNGYQIGGTYSITNNSTQTGLNFTTAVTGGQIIFPDSLSSTYTYSGTKTVVQTQGFGTPTLLDDVYNITGKHSFASSASGKSLVDSIGASAPLVVEGSCQHIVSGIINFVYTDGSTSLAGTFDYGSGTCDNKATIKIGAFTKNVTLPW